tara:strand:+ start:4003 stop:4653 length:651 start_codon:yes stop_codon:yes gene_type:complete
MAKNLSKKRTRKRGLLRKISHDRRIQSKKSISKNKLAPGMMVTFSYNNTGGDIYDRNPFVLFLYEDKPKKLLHCINLNYLQESVVQKLFKNISEIVPVEFSGNTNLNKPFTGVDMTGDDSSGNISNDKKASSTAKVLYEKVIKPKLLNIPSTENCYRTYSIDKVSVIKVISYKLDVIEKSIRDKSDVSKGEFSSAELHKSILESGENIETDNDENK